MNEQEQTSKWRYFGRDSMRGRVYEVYRCPDNGRPVHKQKQEDVYLLLQDGTWFSGVRESLMDEMFKGEFDEKSDEISEEEAMRYFRTWQAGTWPGRKLNRPEGI